MKKLREEIINAYKVQGVEAEARNSKTIDYWRERLTITSAQAEALHKYNSDLAKRLK